MTLATKFLSIHSGLVIGRFIKQAVAHWICCRGGGASQASKTGGGCFQVRRYCCGNWSFGYPGASAGLYRFCPALVHP